MQQILYDKNVTAVSYSGGKYMINYTTGTKDGILCVICNRAWLFERPHTSLQGDDGYLLIDIFPELPYIRGTSTVFHSDVMVAGTKEQPVRVTVLPLVEMEEEEVPKIITRIPDIPTKLPVYPSKTGDKPGSAEDLCDAPPTEVPVVNPEKQQRDVIVTTTDTEDTDTGTGYTILSHGIDVGHGGEPFITVRCPDGSIKRFADDTVVNKNWEDNKKHMSPKYGPVPSNFYPPPPPPPPPPQPDIPSITTYNYNGSGGDHTSAGKGVGNPSSYNTRTGNSSTSSPGWSSGAPAGWSLSTPSRSSCDAPTAPSSSPKDRKSVV